MREGPLVTQEDRARARALIDQVQDLAWVRGQPWWRETLQRLSRGRWGRRQGWGRAEVQGRPWQDGPSPERAGVWRERSACLDGDKVFAVDYWVCRRCRLGWVEAPATTAGYERLGLARAGLAALRGEYGGDVSWHTAGNHLSREFWKSVGHDVKGGYERREQCPHSY